MLDKKQIQAIFFLNLEWIVKQWRQPATSATHLAQELITDIQCSGDSRSYKGDESLEDEEHQASHLKLTTTKNHH